ncbi:MAG TPA: hypothetical protein VKE70_32690 [Candidatus Solibacter sp.]|nr:hypothetical protein [Candidatus Solibacter sp.]
MRRLALVLLAVGAYAQYAPSIPRTWDDAAIESIELPLPASEYSPVHVRAEFYYQIPVRPIYKSYPIYAPGKEPSGYFEWMLQQEPEIAFDASRLKAEADWLRAGEIVFDAPVSFDTAGHFAAPIRREAVRDPGWYSQTGIPVARDGVMPYASYVIRKKGEIEVGNFSCASCHTRVMPDGTVLKGAQGNFPLDAIEAYREGNLENDQEAMRAARRGWRFLFATPWLKPDPIEQLSFQEIVAARATIPPGVLGRQRTSPLSPVQIPDLIGLKDRRYLDRTGLVRHRDIADLMRYAALNQGADSFASFGGFVPSVALNSRMRPPSVFRRYSDEQLYALALYLYSLQPPPNPNRFDRVAARGQQIFDREGCAACHTPPLYTNNKLMPVERFQVPEDHYRKYDILPVVIGTDPGLTLRTTRGTGYYKVPSLKGVWYRGPFEHNGSVATLEDWFDARRLRDDYIPTGFVGYGLKTRAVRGHEFGLKLSQDDRRALLAFLETL